MVADVFRLVGIQVIKLNLKAIRKWVCFLDTIYNKIK